jgi:hypothetical protein
MYSSILKVDIVAKSKTGTEVMYVQTDHRTKDEIASEPEISILFALSRMLNAKAHAKQAGHTDLTVIYACMDEPTPELTEALASTGATLEVRGGERRTKLEPVAPTPSELADQAFRGLVKRVQGRVGLTDLGGTLRALEAETLADPPDVEEDEIGYWTRVLELAAVTAEILRAKYGGTWVETDVADVPFGFQHDNMSIVLATNRASRFIADGAGESMFTLIDSANEMQDHEGGPVLPSLRSWTEAKRENMVFRPLLSNTEDSDIPVIAYGTDSPKTFGLMRADREHDKEKLHKAALDNICGQKVDVEDMDIAGVEVVVVTNSFFATEKVLDHDFMKTLHERTGSEMLAVAVPRRGLMFATNAMPKDPLQAMAVLRRIAEHEAQTTRAISSAILLVQDGNVVGQVQLSPGDDAPHDEDAAPQKKKGFFKRLFGG